MRKRSGFTLVELLVVIGIIALLISILLPAMNTARQSANTIKCAAALRELGNGFLMYAQDNKQFIPPVKIDKYTIDNTYFDSALAADDLSDPMRPKIGNQGFWYNFLTKYVARSAKVNAVTNADKVNGTYLRKTVIWGCPTFKAYVDANNAANVVDGVNRNFTGYGMNAWPTNSASKPSLGADEIGGTGDTSGGKAGEEFIDPLSGGVYKRWYKVTAYTQPAQRALLADGLVWTLKSRSPNAAGDNLTCHNYELNGGTDMLGAVGGGQTNCDLFRHGKPAAIALAGKTGYFATSGGRVAYNVLYADGHVQTENTRAAVYQATRMRFPR